MSVLLLLSTQLLFSQTDTIKLSLTDTSLFLSDLFETEEPLECILELNIKKFQREKKYEKYHPATLIAYPNDTSIIKKNVRIKARGIFRKNHCSLPPYWLNIRRNKNKDPNKDINEKYKVVCHCNYNTLYEEYILKEYLAYKIYNLLTDYSFRVRLVKFTYVDTGRKNKTYHRWGFLIEPIESVAKRLGGVQMKLNTIGMYHTDPETTDLLCMNAYFMGNTDWSIVGRHNIKLIKLLDDSKPAMIPIPYDFDYTGFVNTNYAKPADGTGLTNVRSRLYVGPCRDLTDYMIQAQKIQLKKDEIYRIIDDFEHLPKSVKSDLRDFINQYFMLVERNEFFKYHIDIDCYDLDAEED